MKRLQVVLFILLVVASVGNAQKQITRNELLKLYYEANVAVESKNDSVAVERFLTIIKHVPSMPEPYLRVARLYDVDGAGREHIEAAILMYRHYVDMELDLNKSKDARERLCELEKSLNIPLFVEYSETKEYQPADVDSIPASQDEIEDILALNDVPAETVEETVEPVEEITEETVEESVVETIEEAVAETVEESIDESVEDMVGDVAEETGEEPEGAKAETLPIVPQFDVMRSRFGEHSKFPELSDNIVVIPENTYAKALAKKQMTLDDICGRWVSGTRMQNSGREVWVLDIAYEQNELKVAITKGSGAYQMAAIPDAQSSMVGGDRALMNASLSGNTHVTMALDNYSGNDIRYETMLLLNNLESKNVPAGIENDELSFEYVINKSYTPSSVRHDINRQSANKFSETLNALTGNSPLAGLFSSLISAGVELAQENDVAFSVEGLVGFRLTLTECGLVGTCKEVLAHVSQDGVRQEKCNNVFNCIFYKVPNNFYGSVARNFEKTSMDEDFEEKILKEAKKKFKDDKEKRYLIDAIAKGYNLGKGTASRWNPLKGIKSFIKASNEGNVYSTRVVAILYYELSQNKNYSNSKRRKYLAMAEKYSERLKTMSPVDYCIVQGWYSQTYDIMNGYAKSVSFYQEAIEKYNSDEARYNLAQMMMKDGNEAEQQMATELLTAAVDNGYSPAMISLATLYKDYDDSESFIALVDMALKRNDYNALKLLSLAYQQGIGVKQDYAESARIFDKYICIYNKEWRAALGWHINIE